MRTDEASVTPAPWQSWVREGEPEQTVGDPLRCEQVLPPS